MARKARIHVPGVFQHVMSRGIEGRDIFSDAADRRVFLSLLSSCLAGAGHRCYAWVLMPNHYHLLVQTGVQPLGPMMRRLNSLYARYYGRRYERRGYLFQDRYKSIATQDQKYVLEVLRYIHLNPIRAGLCHDMRSLATYPWCGHGVLLGRHTCAFQDAQPVLRCFGTTTNRARRNYEQFIENGLGQDNESLVIGTVRKNNRGVESRSDGGCWVIGDAEFVCRVLQEDRVRRARVAKYIREGWNLGRVLKKIADASHVTPADVLRRSRTGPALVARRAFCWLTVKYFEFNTAEVASFLGVSTSAVSIAARKAERHAGMLVDMVDA